MRSLAETAARAIAREATEDSTLLRRLEEANYPTDICALIHEQYRRVSQEQYRVFSTRLTPWAKCAQANRSARSALAAASAWLREESARLIQLSWRERRSLALARPVVRRRLRAGVRPLGSRLLLKEPPALQRTRRRPNALRLVGAVTLNPELWRESDE